MPENTLFYSRHCKYCKNLILQLKRADLLNYFTKKICVDDPQIRKRLPKYVKEVPTIITDDYDQPLSSDFAFKWVTFKIQEKQKLEAQKQSQQKQKNSDVCIPGAMDCYGGLTEVGDNLKPDCRLDGEGKSINTSINYDSFSLINPNQLRLDGQGKTINTEINYDAFNITGNADLKAEVQSHSGAVDTDYDKLMKMREMDDNFFGNNGQMRNG
jgi:hypothetical protein